MKKGEDKDDKDDKDDKESREDKTADKKKHKEQRREKTRQRVAAREKDKADSKRSDGSTALPSGVIHAVGVVHAEKRGALPSGVIHAEKRDTLPPGVIHAESEAAPQEIVDVDGEELPSGVIHADRNSSAENSASTSREEGEVRTETSASTTNQASVYSSEPLRKKKTARKKSKAKAGTKRNGAKKKKQRERKAKEHPLSNDPPRQARTSSHSSSASSSQSSSDSDSTSTVSNHYSDDNRDGAPARGSATSPRRSPSPDPGPSSQLGEPSYERLESPRDSPPDDTEGSFTEAELKAREHDRQTRRIDKYDEEAISAAYTQNPIGRLPPDVLNRQKNRLQTLGSESAVKQIRNEDERLRRSQRGLVPVNTFQFPSNALGARHEKLQAERRHKDETRSKGVEKSSTRLQQLHATSAGQVVNPNVPGPSNMGTSSDTAHDSSGHSHTGGANPPRQTSESRQKEIDSLMSLYNHKRLAYEEGIALVGEELQIKFLREACVIHADALVHFKRAEKPAKVIEKEEDDRITSLLTRHNAAMLAEETQKTAKANFIDDDRQITRVLPLSQAQRITAQASETPAPPPNLTSAEQIEHQQLHPPSQRDMPIDQSYGVRPMETTPAPVPAPAPTPAPRTMAEVPWELPRVPPPAPAPMARPAPSSRLPRGEEPNRANDMRYPPGTVFAEPPEPSEEISNLRSTVQKLQAQIAASSRPRIMSEFRAHVEDLLSLDNRSLEEGRQRQQFNQATRDLLLKFTAEADRQKSELKAAKEESARVTAENLEHVNAKRKYKLETKMRKEKALECEDLKLQISDLKEQLEGESSPTGPSSKTSPKRKKPKRVTHQSKRGSDAPQKKKRDRSRSSEDDRDDRHGERRSQDRRRNSPRSRPQGNRRDDRHHSSRGNRNDRPRSEDARDKDRGRSRQEHSGTPKIEWGNVKDHKKDAPTSWESTTLVSSSNDKSEATGSDRSPSAHKVQLARSNARNDTIRQHVPKGYQYYSNREDTLSHFKEDSARWIRASTKAWNVQKKHWRATYLSLDNKRLQREIDETRQTLKMTDAPGHRTSATFSPKAVEKEWRKYGTLRPHLIPARGNKKLCAFNCDSNSPISYIGKLRLELLAGIQHERREDAHMKSGMEEAGLTVEDHDITSDFRPDPNHKDFDYLVKMKAQYRSVAGKGASDQWDHAHDDGFHRVLASTSRSHGVYAHLSDATIRKYNRAQFGDRESKYRSRADVQLAFDTAAYKTELQQEAEDGWNSILNPQHNVQDGTLPKGDYESEEAEDSPGSDSGSPAHTSEDHDSNGQDGS
jgi:hypothetical protein